MTDSASTRVHNTAELLRLIASHQSRKDIVTCARVSNAWWEIATDEIYREIDNFRFGMLLDGTISDASAILSKVRTVTFSRDAVLRENLPLIRSNHPQIRRLVGARKVEVDLEKKRVWVARCVREGRDLVDDERDMWPEDLTIGFDLTVKEFGPGVFIERDGGSYWNEETRRSELAETLNQRVGKSIEQILQDNILSPATGDHRVVCLESWEERGQTPMKLPLNFTWRNIANLPYLREITGHFQPPATAAEILDLIQSKQTRLETLNLVESVRLAEVPSVCLSEVPEILATLYDTERSLIKTFCIATSVTPLSAASFQEKAATCSRQWFARYPTMSITISAAINARSLTPSERKGLLYDLARGYVDLSDGEVTPTLSFRFIPSVYIHTDFGLRDLQAELHRTVGEVLAGDPVEDIGKLFV